jgi:hypothetical protein
VRWVASLSASCFHATAALVAKTPLPGTRLTDARLTDALAAPAAGLVEELTAAGIEPAAFFEQLVPLAAGIENNRELAEVALARLIGRQAALAAAGSIYGWLSSLEAAFAMALPGVVDELALRSGPLREQWEARGPGLLAGIERQTEPGLLVDEAEVALVHPALGGAGSAHMAYNKVTIEAVLANPIAELPEVARLGWLLSTLNLDLPRFTENVPRDRVARMAMLAMLPPALSAAEEVELVRGGVAALPTALTAWRLAPLGATDMAQTLAQWWETYRETRPTWAVALSALDRMLG